MRTSEDLKPVKVGALSITLWALRFEHFRFAQLSQWMVENRGV
jgi:aromatic ring-cleaving dioxygenase